MTSFDWGCIRWACIFGGAWTKPGQWSKIDVVMQDMPNVPGFGLLEQAGQNYPYLGIEWFKYCYQISRNLFARIQALKATLNTYSIGVR
ncbi:MAG: hypothetical protein JXR70_02265 [Spirochaetales bacterium]|nr:hypothetical protein [Spirochaetales bacterium]